MVVMASSLVGCGMGNRIGGTLDLAALSALATLHRPDDLNTLRREAQHLASHGLTPLDIGQALGLSPAAVADLLGQDGAS